jgi:hypothetical protein
MITGFNTDVEYNGRVYHIQTEDKGSSNPVIESLVYVGGEILASVKSPYPGAPGSAADPASIMEKLESQHRRMIMNVRQGRFDPEGVKPFGAGIISDRGFDEVVLEYLRSQRESESFQVVLESPAEFIQGGSTELVLAARGEISSLPVCGAKVAVRLITTLDKPVLLGEGRTDDSGILRLPLEIPRVGEGDAAVILQATRGDAQVEMKWMVRKTERGS